MPSLSTSWCNRHDFDPPPCHLNDILNPKCSGGVTLLHCNSKQLGQLLYIRPDLLASSKPFRYATLAMSSFLAAEGNRQNDSNVHEYLGRFYSHTRDAINTLSYVDLVYACCMIFIYTLSTNPRAETVQMHLNGLRKSLISIKFSREALAKVDTSFAKLLWVSVLRLLRIFLYSEIKRTSGASMEIVKFGALSDTLKSLK